MLLHTAVVAAVAVAEPPTKPTWPALFSVRFQEFWAGGDGKNSEAFYLLDADYVDNATSKKGAQYVARSGSTLDSSCHAVNPGNACDTIVVAGQRYLSFDDAIPGTRTTCCRCCSWENGCGPLMPKWTDSATYTGTKIVRGEPCYSYSIPGLQNNSLSVRVSDGRICDLDNAGTDFFEFIPSTYKPSVPAGQFEVPAGCDTWCGAHGECALG
jgi:hypothetical protein